jgi:hypothetical protein
MTLDDDALRRMLAPRGPAEPAPDLVDRIMAEIPEAPAAVSPIEQWIRVARPIALFSAAAAAVLALALRPDGSSRVRDPVAELTADAGADVGRLLALSR